MEYRRASDQADSQRAAAEVGFIPEKRVKAHVMARRQVSFEELFSILDVEYGKVRPVLCRACVTPLPIRRIPADEVSSNWFVVDPVECDHHCNVVLAEIVTQMMSEYELGRSRYVGATRTSRTRSSP